MKIFNSSFNIIMETMIPGRGTNHAGEPTLQVQFCPNMSVFLTGQHHPALPTSYSATDYATIGDDSILRSEQKCQGIIPLQFPKRENMERQNEL